MSAGVKKEEADEKKHEPAGKSGDALPEHVPGTSIPLLVLEHAASSGLDVLVDLVTGYRYRGKIQSFDQHNMNTTLREVVVTKPVRPDYFAQMHEVFVRGSQIVNIVLPSQLAPEYERRAKAYKRFYNAARLAHRKETRKERRAKAATAEDRKPPAAAAGKAGGGGDRGGAGRRPKRERQ